MCAFHWFISYCVFNWLGNGVDYTSTAVNATFTAGTASTTVNVSVTNDNILEPSEMFGLIFTSPSMLSTRVLMGNPNMATGNIIDSTGKD